MTRDLLRRLLSTADGQAVALFTSLLEDSRATLEVEPDQGSSATSNLLTIYRRRAEHVRSIDLPTLGFDESVTQLASTGHDRLRLAAVRGPGEYPWSVAFLAEDLSEVVAVLAVLVPPPPKQGRQSALRQHRVRPPA